MKNNEQKKESLSSGELMFRAINRIEITDADWLAIYRDPKNWKQEYENQKCKWVWNGPLICPLG